MAVTQQAETDPAGGTVYIWRVSDGSQQFVFRYPAALNPQHLVNASYPALDKRTVPAGTTLTYAPMDAAALAILGLNKEVANIFTINGASALTWTNQPSALTQAPGTLTRLPLMNVEQVRMTCHVLTAGAASAVLIAQVSLDGSTWTNGPQVSLAATGLQVSALMPVPAGFQKDVFFRIVGQGGDGAADPVVGLTTIQIA